MHASRLLSTSALASLLGACMSPAPGAVTEAGSSADSAGSGTTLTGVATEPGTTTASNTSSMTATGSESGSTDPLDTTSSLTSSTGSDTNSSTSNETGSTGVPTPDCGNGMIETDEQCDDGNNDDSDSCVTGCKTATCGDGFVHADVEACDDANTIDTDACPSTCQIASCGDGFVHLGVETCDSEKDANGDPAPKCTDCNHYCGDGVIQLGEDCDDGMANGPVTVAFDENGKLADPAWCSTECKRRYRYVFLSSKRYQGKFSATDGIKGADGRCQTLADTASLEDDSPFANKNLIFRAWISTNKPDAGPMTWAKSDVPYILPDKSTIVAASYAALQQPLENPILLDENAETPPTCENPTDTTCVAWTNTLATGSPHEADNFDCTNWTSVSGSGHIGKPGQMSDKWTYDDTTRSCGSERHLYCFEQPPTP